MARKPHKCLHTIFMNMEIVFFRLSSGKQDGYNEAMKKGSEFVE